MSQPPIVIVGGGVIGVCAAYYLTRAGHKVLVVERDKLGGAASFGNAGSIAPGHAPINRPGRMWQAIKWMFNGRSPLHIAKPWDPGIASWLIQFQAKCHSSHFQACMNLLGPMGHETQRLYDELIEEERLDCDYRRRGYYEVYATEEGMAHAEQELALSRELGYEVDTLSASQIRDQEPSLSESIRGATHHREASTCDPHAFVVELAKRAESMGAEFRCGASVQELLVEKGIVRGLQLEGGEEILGHRVVLATGAYSLGLLAKLGKKLPLQPAKGYHRDSRPGPSGSPPLNEACILSESFVFCTPMNDVVRFAGTLEFSGLNHDMRQERLDELTEAARRYFQEVGDEDSQSEWCGLRPCLPDGMPIIGWVPGVEGLYIANGHAMMGLTLGPVTGKMIADDFSGKEPAYDRRLLDPSRYLRG